MINSAIKEALEIAEKVTVARMQNSGSAANEESGKRAGEFFNAFYETILPNVEKIRNEEK